MSGEKNKNTKLRGGKRGITPKVNKRREARSKGSNCPANRCERAKATPSRVKVTVTAFELFYTTPQSDEDIIRSIRENYLEAMP